MNRRTTFIIGAALILLALVFLGYVGYLIFGNTDDSNRTPNEQFYLEQSGNVLDAQDHIVVVRAVMQPPSGQPADWACSVRAWDWGDGNTTRDTECTEFANEEYVVFPIDHRYEAAGTYPVKMYIRSPQNETFASETLDVVAE